MAVLGITLSLLGLMYFAYRGMNVLLLAPLMALFATLWHTDTPLLATITQVYMPALGGYVVKYLPIFLLGSLFGKLMSSSGAAESIAQKVSSTLGSRHAILAVIMSCAILTYGGVSLFVVAFCMEPLARSLFKEANFSQRYIPGAIAAGAFTFTMTALPGTPSIQNAIPMPYFGTDAFAAPILGIIGGLVMGGLGLWWLKRRTVKGQSKGLVFEQSSESQNKNNKTLPGFLLSITPLLVVFVLNFIFSRYLFPALDASYLSTSLYGNTSLDKVIGTWALVAALAIGVVALLALHFKHLENPMEKINQGTLDCMLPLFNTASEVGYGQVIATLSSFVVIKGLILGLFPSNPLISEAVAVNVLAGITGSASGGLSIALEALGASYLEMAHSMGISPELLHRVASMSCGGFDTLPHNGAVITLLAICKSDHKRSYFDIFMVAVTFPVVATAVVITLGSLFGSF